MPDAKTLLAECFSDSRDDHQCANRKPNQTCPQSGGICNVVIIFASISTY